MRQSCHLHAPFSRHVSWSQAAETPTPLTAACDQDSILMPRRRFDAGHGVPSRSGRRPGQRTRARAVRVKVAEHAQSQSRPAKRRVKVGRNRGHWRDVERRHEPETQSLKHTASASTGLLPHEVCLACCQHVQHVGGTTAVQHDCCPARWRRQPAAPWRLASSAPVVSKHRRHGPSPAHTHRLKLRHGGVVLAPLARGPDTSIESACQQPAPA